MPVHSIRSDASHMDILDMQSIESNIAIHKLRSYEKSMDILHIRGN
jgi:hypothetical protein